MGKQAPQRLHYLDNFRAYLACQVIYYHTASAYRPLNTWYYAEPHPTSAPLTVMSAITHSHVMGSFFALSGHLTAQSLQKGTAANQLIESRASRLLIPAAGYSTIIHPILGAFGRGESFSWQSLKERYQSRELRSPTWYLPALFVMDTTHALLRKLVPPCLPFSNVGTSALVLAFAADVAASFITRLKYPVDYVADSYSIRPAYIPHYLTGYVGGCFLDGIRWRTQRPFLNLLSSVLAMLMISGLFIRLFKPFRKETNDEGRPSYLGGPNWASFAYTASSEIGFFLLFRALLLFFKKYVNYPLPLSRATYGAFLVHPVVITAIMKFFARWNANVVTKTGLVTVLSILGSFSLGEGLGHVPLVGTLVK